MSAIFVRGVGAISPAGWGVNALRETLAKNVSLPVQPLGRPGWESPLSVRPVPPPATPPGFLSHPRLRRSGSLTHHLVGAALEALGGDVTAVQAHKLRLGIVVCLMAGSVNYSRRFYEETLRNPATASPLLFPETVFNAPASHLAAYLGSTGVSHTLVGDEGAFLQGLALGARWLADRQVDACVVIGAEETDWIVADALRLFHRDSIHAAGAGAIYLTASRAAGGLAELAPITDSFPFTAHQNRSAAARGMRAQLPSGGPDEILYPSLQGIPRLDAGESAAWKDWQGAQTAVKIITGQAFTASAAWQCLAACDAIQRREFASACVSVVGANQQAIGARFAQPEFSENH